MTRTLLPRLAVLAAAAVLVAPAAPAAAAAPTAGVTVDRVDGLPADAPTTLQVGGSGFQVVRGGFGGVYVLFGWVDDPAGGAWRPSAGGVTGTHLRYAVDEAARDNAGYQVFVAFPGAATAVEANGGELGDDGTFSTTLTVPGARFVAVDAQGGTSEVDCTQVTCGVVTIGAHGVANATNETFTPVTFAAPGAQDAAAAAPRVAAATAEPSPSAASTQAAATAPVAGSTGGRPWLPVAIGAGALALLTAVGASVRRTRRRPTAT
ncbi:hypothetical protein [Cellulomonas phragmiteti]|uniref:Htaa domain-containing protein n=1 Tax=Cellulomonas phragmiteti TaxID=478780 RepID=A0ABQ4DLV9_9CELL|nr:hypothetical protein [Cellulomonas phragmiteti]GIG40333.1 hypothetical protein Cph01nite_20950 [Cellulomonas phragmiteti]